MCVLQTGLEFGIMGVCVTTLGPNSVLIYLTASHPGSGDSERPLPKIFHTS